jgi:1,4-dihydroxy-2-naphthoate octaprenyltransferase
MSGKSKRGSNGNPAGEKVGMWLGELRAPFFTAAIIPVIAGGVTAWAYFGVFLPLEFFLTLMGAVFLHAGTNVINDYFDYKSGNDTINDEKNQPFSGGSPYLPAGRLSPSSVYATAIVFFAAGSAIGLYLAFAMGLQKGWVVILLGIVGVGAGYFYVEPRINLCGRGVGELFIGLCFGPLMVFGAFYVQTRSFSIIPLVVGIPIGFLIAAVVYINQFPDYNADRAVGKRNIVVRLGRKKAVRGYHAVIACVYLSIAVAALAGLLRYLPAHLSVSSLSPLSLVALATIPLAVKSSGILNRHYSEHEKLVPAQAFAIATHLLTGLLLCVSIGMSAVLGLL